MPGDDRRELRKEAYTMALYVSITLLAALTAAGERSDASHVDVLGIVWGTTVGLALVHWFAFRLSARFVAQGRVARHDVDVALAQLAGAAFVAVLGTVPVLLLPTEQELDVDRVLLALFVGAIAYATARSAGASRFRGVAYASVATAAALGVAIVKNVLSGH